MPLGPAVSVYSSIRWPVYLKPHCLLVPSRPWTQGTEPVHMETTVILACHYRVYAIAPPMLVTGWVMLQDGEFWWWSTCRCGTWIWTVLTSVVGPVPKREESDAVTGVLCNWRSCQRPRIFCYPAWPWLNGMSCLSALAEVFCWPSSCFITCYFSSKVPWKLSQ